VVGYAPFVGPVGDALPGVRAALADAGVALRLVRRPWDARLFPCARRGYFDFWARAQRWLKDGRTEAELPLFAPRAAGGG
jgi:deoxyribodipyrimidine photo-lyase